MMPDPVGREPPLVPDSGPDAHVVDRLRFSPKARATASACRMLDLRRQP